MFFSSSPCYNYKVFSSKHPKLLSTREGGTHPRSSRNPPLYWPLRYQVFKKKWRQLINFQNREMEKTFFPQSCSITHFFTSKSVHLDYHSCAMHCMGQATICYAYKSSLERYKTEREGSVENQGLRFQTPFIVFDPSSTQLCLWTQQRYFWG